MARIRRKVAKTGAQPRKRERKIKLKVEETSEDSEKKLAQDQELSRQLSKIIQYTVIPAGVPPYDLEGDDIVSIKDWIQQIKSTGNHTVQSCQYWVSYFYDPSSQRDKWKTIRKIIEDNQKDFGLLSIPFSKEIASVKKKDKKKFIDWTSEEDTDSEVEFSLE